MLFGNKRVAAPLERHDTAATFADAEERALLAVVIWRYGSTGKCSMGPSLSLSVSLSLSPNNFAPGFWPYSSQRFFFSLFALSIVMYRSSCPSQTKKHLDKLR